jgi:hypothetical protein
MGGQSKIRLRVQFWWYTSIISSPQKAENWRTVVKPSLGKRVGEIHLNQKSGAWWHTPVIPATAQQV